MSSISPIRQYPALLGSSQPTGGAAPVAPMVQAQAVAPASYPQYAQPIQAQSNYNWNYANPKDHIFDHPYDGYAMNKGLMKLGGVGFWTRFGVTRQIASMITKIPTQRLEAYAVREKFMHVQGMTPDYARILQQSYFNATGGQQPLSRNAPLSWLGQFGQPGGIADFTVRGPLIVEMNMNAFNYALQWGYKPDVPGNNTLERLAQGAAMQAPPQYYQQPGYGQYPGGYPQMPGQYPGGYPYGNNPINQIGNLIGQIGQIFK